MNKFIKVCLSIAGILVAFGLVLFVIGAMFGGIKQTAGIARLGGFNYSFSDDGLILSTIDWDWEDEEYAQKEYEFEVADIDELKIEVGACRLNVEQYEGETYKVEAQNVYQLKCFVEDGVLAVDGTRDISSQIERRRVTIYVPKGVDLDNLDISLGAGSGRVESITAQEIEVEIGAGELEGTDLKAKEVKILVGAGSVVFDDCEFEDTKFDVGFGSAVYKGVLTGDVTVDCGMGNVDMKLIGEREDFNYEIECDMGEVEIDRTKYSGMGSNKNEDNDAVKTMDLDCAMGHVSIRFDE